MARNKTYIDFQTPVGTARYPKLHKKDVYEGKETKYVLDVTFDSPEDVKKVKAAIKAAQDRLFPDPDEPPRGTPWRKKKDKKTGEVVEYLHTSSTRLVTVYLKDGKTPLPEGKVLGGGSKIRVKLSFTEGNKFLVAYANLVQVGKLVEGNSGGGGFDELDGFEDEDDGAARDGFDAMSDDDDLDI